MVYDNGRVLNIPTVYIPSPSFPSDFHAVLDEVSELINDMDDGPRTIVRANKGLGPSNLFLESW